MKITPRGKKAMGEVATLIINAVHAAHKAAVDGGLQPVLFKISLFTAFRQATEELLKERV